MPLQLGTVTFTDDEAPENLPLGGKQQLAVIDYPGGQREIQALGAFDNPISWSGALWFQPAISRMAALNAMRISGQPVTLQFDGLSVQVVVAEFVPDYRNPAYIPYRITVQPQTVMSMQPGAQQTPVPVVIQGTASSPLTSSDGSTSDLGTGGTVTISGGDTLGQLAMTPAQLGNTSSVAPVYNTGQEFSSAAAAPVGSIINQMSPATSAATTPALSAASTLVHLVAAGETLFHIATQYYADATQWVQIAAANNIQNPTAITVGQQLNIPNPTQGN